MEAGPLHAVLRQELQLAQTILPYLQSLVKLMHTTDPGRLKESQLLVAYQIVSQFAQNASQDQDKQQQSQHIQQQQPQHYQKPPLQLQPQQPQPQQHLPQQPQAPQIQPQQQQHYQPQTQPQHQYTQVAPQMLQQQQHQPAAGSQYSLQSFDQTPSPSLSLAQFAGTRTQLGDPSHIPLSPPVGKPSFKKRVYALDQFDLETTLGTGAYASVRLAREKATGHIYCVKIISKSSLTNDFQITHVRNEKDVLLKTSHSFIMTLFGTFQDQENVYFLLEYIPGGELFTQISIRKQLPEAHVRFYAAEIASALNYLHSMNIVHRDLKTENLLLDSAGHIKLSDFGFAKFVADKTWTMCGTPEYIAPEMIHAKGHNKAVDWWALGILIYEMLVGYTPFRANTPYETFQKILLSKAKIPSFVSPQARDIITQLLELDPMRRLGSSHLLAGEEVLRHPWFESIDWDILNQKGYKPPIDPGVTSPDDTHNFAQYME